LRLNNTKREFAIGGWRYAPGDWQMVFVVALAEARLEKAKRMSSVCGAYLKTC